MQIDGRAVDGCGQGDVVRACVASNAFGAGHGEGVAACCQGQAVGACAKIDGATSDSGSEGHGVCRGTTGEAFDVADGDAVGSRAVTQDHLVVAHAKVVNAGGGGQCVEGHHVVADATGECFNVGDGDVVVFDREGQYVSAGTQVDEGIGDACAQRNDVCTAVAQEAFSACDCQRVATCCQDQFVGRTCSEVNVTGTLGCAQCDRVGTGVAHNGFHVAGGNGVGAIGKVQLVGTTGQVNHGVGACSAQRHGVIATDARDAFDVGGGEGVGAGGQRQGVSAGPQVEDATCAGVCQNQRVGTGAAGDSFDRGGSEAVVGIGQHNPVCCTCGQVELAVGDTGAQSDLVRPGVAGDGLQVRYLQNVGAVGQHQLIGSARAVHLHVDHALRQGDQVCAGAAHQRLHRCIQGDGVAAVGKVQLV